MSNHLTQIVRTGRKMEASANELRECIGGVVELAKHIKDEKTKAALISLCQKSDHYINDLDSDSRMVVCQMLDFAEAVAIKK